MKSEFVNYKIENLADVKSGKRLPKGYSLVSTKTNFPYIRLVDVSDGLVQQSAMLYLTKETQEKISRYIVKTGDICLAIVGNTIGMVFQIDKSWNNANLTENAARLTNFKDNVTSQYIYYFLTSTLGQNEILSRKVGSAQGKLPMYNIKSLEIPLPSLPTQQKIAHILSTLDDKIELNRKVNETLEAMAQALFKSWFVDFDPVHAKTECAVRNEEVPLGCKSDAELEKAAAELGISKAVLALFPSTFVESEMGMIPEGWEECKLSDVLEIKYGKDHKELDDGNIPVYGSGGIMRYADSLLYDKESILIPRKGTLTNLFYIDEPFWTVDTIFWSKINTEKVSGKFLFSFLKTIDLSNLNVGSAVPSLTTKVLNEIKISIPTIDEQKEFNQYADAAWEKMKSNSKQIKTLEEMRDTLLPKLLSGEIDVPDIDK